MRSKPFSSALKFFALLILIMVSHVGAWTSAQAQLEGIYGVGFIEEEGEFLADSGWTNDDWVNVGIETVTSGGNVTFGLAHCAGKYLVHLFFSTAVKPLEFYIYAIQQWHFTTGLRVPEEFRMMTLMMIDERLDIAWFQSFCAELSVREGWDHVYGNPFEIYDPAVHADPIDGEPPLIGEAEMRDVPEQASFARESIHVGKIAPQRNLAPGLELPTSFVTSIRVRSSKVFEIFVNVSGMMGYLEKSIGIPKGCIFIDLSYGRVGGNGLRGVDGFFLDKATGKTYLLEMKWYGMGGGRLGRIFGRRIVQGSPQWLQRCMLQVCKTDPDRWLKIKDVAEGTRFGKLCTAVELVKEHAATFAKESGRVHVQANLENFDDMDGVYKLLVKHMGPSVDEVGGYLAEDFAMAVVNKTGGKPRYIEEVGSSMTKCAKAFGRNVKDLPSKFRWTWIKGVLD